MEYLEMVFSEAPPLKWTHPVASVAHHWSVVKIKGGGPRVPRRKGKLQVY